MLQKQVTMMIGKHFASTTALSWKTTGLPHPICFEDAWSEPEKAEVAALDGPELLNDADA